MLQEKFNLLTVVSYTLSTIVFGCLSDKINKKYIILFGLVGLAIASYPFIMSLKSANSSFILIMSLIMGAFIGATEGTLNPLVAESFPTQIRATSVAFCWNFTSVAFGSISPIIAMLLIKNTGEINSIAYYLMGVCFVSISGVLFGFMRKGNC